LRCRSTDTPASPRVRPEPCGTLALGDSISIDKYTGVVGGGAVSQLARRLGAELIDLTRDGEITDGVLRDLERPPADVDVVTVTAGGNDLLMGRPARAIVRNLEQIGARLARLEATVVLNTVYDPTDGDDAVGRELLGLPPETRVEFDAVNAAVKQLAHEHAFLVADLERLFHGHGVASKAGWYVGVIEPGLAGATAIAEHWHELLAQEGVVRCHG
jgi:lysophospholipase L1-like esterase